MPKLVDHEARREEISGIVAGLIARGGLEAATIREIARSSGYSKGVIEHYFEDKAALISGALAWVNLCFEERLSRASKDTNGLQALRGMIEATLPLTAQIRDEWKVRLVFWGMAAIDPDLGEAQARRLDAAIQRYATHLRAAADNGEIDALDDYPGAARHLLNITSGACTAALHQRDQYTQTFLMAEIDRLIARVASIN